MKLRMRNIKMKTPKDESFNEWLNDQLKIQTEQAEIQKRIQQINNRGTVAPEDIHFFYTTCRPLADELIELERLRKTL